MKVKMATTVADTNAKKQEEKVVVVPRTAADVQRLKLEKLMKKAEKPVVIPEKPPEKQPGVFNPPEFIRHIWGSSAGAGSGDFHVYRGIRRREYARQKLDKEKSAKDEKEDDYHRKVEENKKVAEQKTAKKRAKRQKKKLKQKAQKKQKKNEEGSCKEESSSEEEDQEKIEA